MKHCCSGTRLAVPGRAGLGACGGSLGEFVCRWQSRHLKGSNEAKLDPKQTAGPRAPMLVWNAACEWARARGMNTTCLFFIQKGKRTPPRG